MPNPDQEMLLNLAIERISVPVMQFAGLNLIGSVCPSIPFDFPFGVTFADNPVVIATGYARPSDQKQAKIAPLISGLSTTGCKITAKNTDCDSAGGFAGVICIAIGRLPPAGHGGGTVPQINHFPFSCDNQPSFASLSNNCQPGDSAATSITPSFGDYFVLLTPRDGPVVETGVVTTNNIIARNSDTSSRDSAFYWLAVGNNPLSPQDLQNQHNYVIQWGVTTDQNFAKTDTQGDWQQWDVHFQPQFGAPPAAVLVTPITNNVDTAATPMAYPVGIAVDVGATGFTLKARNSENNSGNVRFNWIASG